MCILNDPWNDVVSSKPVSENKLKSKSQIRILACLVFEKIDVNVPNFPP